MSLPKKIPCPQCRGSGLVERRPNIKFGCETCGGSGKILETDLGRGSSP